MCLLTCLDGILMSNSHEARKGSSVKPNTEESDVIDTAVDPVVEPQSVLRQIGKAMKDEQEIAITPDAAQWARGKSEST